LTSRADGISIEQDKAMKSFIDKTKIGDHNTGD